MRPVQDLCAMIVALGCAITPISAQARQPEIARPNAAGRLVREFDFNSHSPTPLPITRWYRGQSAPEQGRERPGFPVWNGAFVDYRSPAFEGVGSLKLPTEGGSTSVKLRRGVVPIFASADYMVTAMVRTEGLVYAGAVLEVWQVDDAGREIEASRTRSKVLRGAHDWTPVGVEILAQDTDAAFLQIELLLLQPKALKDPNTDPEVFKIWDEDFSGAAWFDSIGVHQLPRIELKAPNPGNVIRAPEPPTLEVVVRDLAGESLVVEMTIFDLWGREVDSRKAILNSGRFQEQWQPKIHKYGWYRGMVRLRSESGAVVGGARSDFLYLEKDPRSWRTGVASALDGYATPGLGRSEFGLAFDTMPETLISALPTLAAASGAGSVTLPVWLEFQRSTEHRERVDQIAPAIERLLARGAEVTLAFDRVPASLARAAGVESTKPLELFSLSPDLWSSYTEPYLDRFGQRVRRWQIGRAGDDGQSQSTASTIEKTRTELGKLVPGPTVTIPWRSDQQIPKQLLKGGVRLSLSLVEGIDDTSLSFLAKEWGGVLERALEESTADSGTPTPRSGDLPELELIFNTLPAEPFGLAAGVADLIKRAVLARHYFGHLGARSAADRAAGRVGTPVSLKLENPVTYSGLRRTQVSPVPALGAWAQLVDRLEGRSIAGEIKLGEGIRCFMLKPRSSTEQSRGGSLILWREDAPTADATLDLYLGPGNVKVIDMFGNQSPAQRTQIGPRQQPAHHIPVTADPIYIEGVDTDLVEFLSSIRLAPALVESKNIVHQHELIIENPWTTPIRGRAFILEPGGYSTTGRNTDRRWEITPRVIDFSIPGSGIARVPLEIEISAGTPAGTKPFVLDIEIVAQQDYGMVRVAKTIELGLDDLKLEVFYRVGSREDPSDVFLEARITNLSNRALNLELASVVPGFPRGKAFINGIKPHEMMVRSFPLPKSYDRLRGKQAAVSLIESGGASHIRLIKSVRID